MPTALVTGATGFIGPHLVRVLREAGWKVVCLVRSPERAAALRPFDVRLVAGDLTAESSLTPALAGVDVVFHLAGLTKAFLRAEYERVNVAGTGHLLEACLAQTTPPVLVLVSSLAAAGPAPEGRARRESDPPCPVSAYGRSKLAAEHLAIAHAGRLPLTIVRPPIVFGQGDRDVLRMFHPIAKYGIHPVPTRATLNYSLIHATDLAQSLRLAAERGARVAPGDAWNGGGSYFVAFDQRPTYVELGRLMSQALGRERVRVIRAPQTAMWLVGLLGEVAGRLRGQPMIVNLDKARESTAGSWTCDPARATSELGFAPGRSLPERLAETATWYQEQRWL